ncbi:unnamed protein product [Medioppia subpectinata]|uniref:NOT2/NOT3/NOT5 C-terminal domain-containing protein n=1 Tax=Medioppia subpectinata TaxID=1979941 RepID=A0A7R9KZ53_9ACAR|nr:unnamed protein product [Medioppia subpectinata]CAG2112255.1 unnamed protein product [Medioppia subpectinata]
MGSQLTKNSDTNRNPNKTVNKSNPKSRDYINNRRKSSVDSVSTPEYITSTAIEAIGSTQSDTKTHITGHRSDHKIPIPAEIVVVSDGSAIEDIPPTIAFPPSFKPLIPIGYESLSHNYPQLKPEYVITFGLIIERHLKTKSEFVAKEQQKLIDRIRDLDSIVSYISNQFIIERQKRLIKVSDNLLKVEEISALIEKCDKDIDNCVKNFEKLNQFLPKALALEKFDVPKMSSPSPGPLSTAQTIGNIPARRVSNSFVGLTGLGDGGRQQTGPLTPPLSQHSQHSPNSFLAGLSSRLFTNKGRLPDLLDITSGSLSNSNLLGYRNSMHTFGVVGGSVGGPPAPSLDMTEFPTLTGSNSNNLLSQSNASGRPAYVGMVKDNVTNNSSSNEFNIQSEDFPALPGSNPNLHFGGSHNENSSLSSASTVMSLGANNMTAGMGHHSGLINNSGAGDANVKYKRGIQTNKEGRVTNIPIGMVTDQFGMVGLLTFIRAAESDQSLVSLALGTDLTTLGLNLNSNEPLYQTFAGPWSDQPLKPPEIDYPVPTEYLINASIRDKLAPLKLNRYGDDLLFFLFYMYAGDIIQILAASELYVRDWRYHKDERIWITRAPGMLPQDKQQTYERGTYYFFDAHNWRKVAKEFCLFYDRLEDRPAAAAFSSAPVLSS